MLDLMTINEVADELRIPVATLYRYNSRGDGPRYVRVGRHCRYRLSDVETWLKAHEHGGPEAA